MICASTMVTKCAAVVLALLAFSTTEAMLAVGPIPGAEPGNPHAGWADAYDGGETRVQPRIEDGALHIHGEARVYLVKDFRKTTWETHKYVRVNLMAQQLRRASS